MRFKMKGNDGTGNIESRDDWETPKWLFDLLNFQYNFEFDCCATKDNNKCNSFSNDFLKLDKPLRTSWMNPPFSKAREMFEHFFNVVELGIAIYRCDNIETGIWQEIILKKADWIFIPKGRISYEGKKGNGSRFPSALIGFNVDFPRGIEGSVLIIRK